MKNYSCEECNMTVKAPVCAKCNQEMQDKCIEKGGKKVQVCECVECHGMIKSPQCCGHDMKYAADEL